MKTFDSYNRKILFTITSNETFLSAIVHSIIP